MFTRHRLTRHQYYLQLRKDILEDRLYCNEETGLFLAALALQAEFGDYMPEVQRIKRKMFKLFFKYQRHLSVCATAAHLFPLCVFIVVWKELLPARALCLQEDAREAGPAQCQGGVAKTTCKSCPDAA